MRPVNLNSIHLFLETELGKYPQHSHYSKQKIEKASEVVKIGRDYFDDNANKHIIYK